MFMNFCHPVATRTEVTADKPARSCAMTFDFAACRDGDGRAQVPRDTGIGRGVAPGKGTLKGDCAVSPAFEP